MKKLIILLLSLFSVWSCGGNSSNNASVDGADTGGANTGSATLTNSPLTNDSMAAVSANFCSCETKFKMLSTSLLSAYSSKGNGSDPNYCGGSNAYTEDGANFKIELKNYCVNFRGQHLTLNGTINGVTDSGANFFSSIIPDLSITGKNVDLSVSGSTKYGRADDMFLDINIDDNITAKQIVFQDVNIKKGEFDLGYFSFNDVGPYEFKFIDHFDADYTTGMLFIYGTGDDYLILSADQGIITVVYKKDRHDPGTLIDVPSCNG